MSWPQERLKSFAVCLQLNNTELLRESTGTCDIGLVMPPVFGHYNSEREREIVTLFFGGSLLSLDALNWPSSIFYVHS